MHRRPARQLGGLGRGDLYQLIPHSRIPVRGRNAPPSPLCTEIEAGGKPRASARGDA